MECGTRNTPWKSGLDNSVYENPRNGFWNGRRYWGKIAIAFQDLEKKLRPKLMEPTFGAVFAGMYLNCFTGASYLEQFYANAGKVNQKLSVIKAQVEKRGCRE